MKRLLLAFFMMCATLSGGMMAMREEDAKSLPYEQTLERVILQRYSMELALNPGLCPIRGCPVRVKEDLVVLHFFEEHASSGIMNAINTVNFHAVAKECPVESCPSAMGWERLDILYKKLHLIREHTLVQLDRAKKIFFSIEIEEKAKAYGAINTIAKRKRPAGVESSKAKTEQLS